MSRMTDERLTEISAGWSDANIQRAKAELCELLFAMEAERAKVAELEALLKEESNVI